MGVVGEIITGGTGLGQVAGLVQDIFDRILPDKDAQAAQHAELLIKAQEIDAQLAQGLTAIDQAEAANSSMFVAGWRPCVGWCCAGAFAYHLIVQPLLTYAMAVFGYTFPLPVFDDKLLSTILMGMLGLGTMRTVEKMSDKGQLLPWQK